MSSDHQNSKCIIDTESTGYNPWSARLICIGIKDLQSGETRVFYDDNEEEMLMKFLQYFNKMKYDEILGYNLPHDLRFIFAKCLRFKIPGNGLFSAIHNDLMSTLKGDGHPNNFNRPGRLNEWTRFLLGREKLPGNTSILALYREHKIQEILKCNRDHLEMTFEVWKRIQLVLQGGGG